MLDRDPFSRLYHAEHKLPIDGTRLGRTEAAYIVVDRRATLGANRGQVTEDDRECLIDQQSQQAGDDTIDGILAEPSAHPRVQP